MLLADCKGVSRRAVAKAADAYRSANVKGGAFETEGGGGSYWESSQDVYVCESEPVDTITYTWPAIGEVLMFIDEGVESCGMIAVWYDVYEGGDDGGGAGDGGGAPTGNDYFTSNITPVAPLADDSVCQTNADPTPNLMPAAGDSSLLPKHGPLMSLAIQDSLAALPNTVSTHENGGFITYNTSTHEYEFVRWPNVETDNSSYFPSGGYLIGTNKGQISSNVYVVAYAHGHPQAGTSLSYSQCPSNPGTVLFQPSDSDRVAADTLAPFTNTNYVVQPTSSGATAILTYGTTFDPTTFAHTRKADDQWTAQGAGQCYSHAF